MVNIIFFFFDILIYLKGKHLNNIKYYINDTKRRLNSYWSIIKLKIPELLFVIPLITNRRTWYTKIFGIVEFWLGILIKYTYSLIIF